MEDPPCFLPRHAGRSPSKFDAHCGSIILATLLFFFFVFNLFALRLCAPIPPLSRVVDGL